MNYKTINIEAPEVFEDSNFLSDDSYFNYLYDLIHDSQDNINDLCFLCGVILNSTNRTDEHVFPKWLIKKFKLNRKLYKYNDIHYTKYSKILVPCCSDCNNGPLSDLENRIKNKLEKGYEQLTELKEFEVIQWLGKIFYGILFNKLSLRQNIRNPKSRPMITDSELSNYRNLLLLVSGINTAIRVHGTPWSLSIYKIETKSDSYFDLFIDPESTFMTIILGEIGIIARFLDNNAISGLSQGHRKQFNDVNPTLRQFYEISAWLHYYSFHDESKKEFTIIQAEQNGVKFIELIPKLISKPIFKTNENTFRSFGYKLHNTFLRKFNLKLEEVYCEKTNSIKTSLDYL